VILIVSLDNRMRHESKLAHVVEFEESDAEVSKAYSCYREVCSSGERGTSFEKDAIAFGHAGCALIGSQRFRPDPVADGETSPISLPPTSIHLIPLSRCIVNPSVLRNARADTNLILC
jgi:hypothetical protein